MIISLRNTLECLQSSFHTHEPSLVHRASLFLVVITTLGTNAQIGNRILWSWKMRVWADEGMAWRQR